MKIRGSLLVLAMLSSSELPAQEKKLPPPDKSAPVFRSETRLVPVDVVVTDKKGNYIHNLEGKDFKVWEDNKEQAIKSFAFEADPNSPLATQKRYIILFFDNSSMNMGDQLQSRQAAVKFIDSNAGPNRLMAVVNFGGTLRIAQNFTDDIERLKQVVSGASVPSVVSNTGIGGPLTAGIPRLGGPSVGGLPGLGGEADFGARSVLLSLRNLAKRMEDVPGRKTLVFLSAGFPFTPDLESEITAAIYACNRANVAIYPIDVRGLATLPFLTPRGALLLLPRDAARAGLAMAGSPVLRIASFLAAPQRGGAGGGTTGGTTGGGSAGGATGGGTPAGGGSRTGGEGSPGGMGAPRAGGGGIGGNSDNTGGFSRGTPSMGGNPNAGYGGRGGGGSTGDFGGRGGVNDPNSRQNPLNRPRDILTPHLPDYILSNQQVLYRLAEGTGGFVIINTNDLLGGLEKINKEQNEYYLLAYTAPETPEGSCHEIRVKVNRGGAVVRSRPGYCNVKAKDMLAGKPIERQLESRVGSSDSGTIPVPPMQAPFFYTAANTARVNVALEIPTKDIKFEKVKGKQHAEISILGVAYRANGDVAARFSDSVKFDFEEKKEVEKFAAQPLQYQNQFDIASGDYTLKVAFTAGGEGFGKVESPLKIEPYDTKEFGMSALVLNREMRKVSGDVSLDAALLEGRTPLIAAGLQFTPAGSNRFKTTDPTTIYFEVYEPLLLAPDPANPAKLGAQLRILERQSGAQKLDSGGVEVSNFIRPGTPVVPIGLKLPVNLLTAGAYRLEMKVVDSAGKTAIRSTDFDVY